MGLLYAEKAGFRVAGYIRPRLSEQSTRLREHVNTIPDHGAGILIKE